MGEGVLCPFQELEKRASVFWKNVLIVVIYGLNFSFKMQFLRISRRKGWRFFPTLFFIL